MLAALLLHGAILVSVVGVYGRWLDEEALADVCLVGLVIELGGGLLLSHYTQATDAAFLCHLGTVELPAGLAAGALLLGFDELSGYFMGLLAFALLTCFFFLTEYFEYDAQAGAIVTLSALFSQAALLYFCAFDLLLILALWEVISLISFFLVQHWAFRLSTFKAGLKVFCISQLGDLPFFFFFFFCLAHFQTTELPELFARLPLTALEYWAIGGLLLHLPTILALNLSAAVFLKAAQWFFYPWLLDAMEAPVPISAQLHSSTLVVIGFYLFFRFQPLFNCAPAIGVLFVCAGGITTLGASVLGFFQEDGKRLLACSTASQLGYVVVCLGLRLPGEALALLLLCCANKAYTFVWLGVYMRRHAGLSDFRAAGGASTLTWLEHAGLLCALANFTVFPGALSWHVKSLIGGAQPSTTPPLLQLGLELLQVSWLWSSLYAIYLYVALFLTTGRAQPTSKAAATGVRYPLTALRAAHLSGRGADLRLWATPAAPRTAGLLPGVLGLALVVLAWHGAPWALQLIDTTWAGATLTSVLTYY